MRARPLFRIAAVAALFVALLPVQAAAIRFGWPLRRSLPAFFHRRVLAILGVRVIETGGLDRRRPLLVVANHVSWLDIPVLSSRGGLSFIAKSEVAGWPAVGLMAKLQRSVFIDRSARRKTGEATAEIGSRLSGGDVMVLFGEGTTSDGLRVLPFRSALVGAAREAAAPGAAPVHVQPLAIRYLRRAGLPLGRGERFAIAWTGDMDLAPHLVDLLSGGPIDVAVSWGEPIAVGPDGDRKALTRALEGQVRDMVRAAGRLER